MLAEVAADICKVFNAPNLPTVESYLKQAVQKYEPSASRLANGTPLSFHGERI